jgi:hypothetical protein
MLRHVVLFKFRDDTTVEQLAAINDGLGALPGLIAELKAYKFGPDLRLGSGTWDYAVTADFDDAAGWLTYDEHPEHNRVRSECFAPVVVDRVSVRFDI